MIKDLLNYIRLGGDDFPYLGISVNQYYPIPKEEDYKVGFIERFFVKRINDYRVIETNRKDYYNLTVDLYLKIQINWAISGKNQSDVYSQNLNSKKSAEKFFSTSIVALKDPLQFYKP